MPTLLHPHFTSTLHSSHFTLVCYTLPPTLLYTYLNIHLVLYPHSPLFSLPSTPIYTYSIYTPLTLLYSNCTLIPLYSSLLYYTPLYFTVHLPKYTHTISTLSTLIPPLPSHPTRHYMPIGVGWGGVELEWQKLKYLYGEVGPVESKYTSQ